MSRPRHMLNLFPVTVEGAAQIDYRHVRVTGIPPTDDQPKQLQQLLKELAYRLKGPVALVCGGTDPMLAVAVDAAIDPNDEIRLTPWAATLEPLDATASIDTSALDQCTAPIAKTFVEFALRGHLMHNPDLWGNARRWFSKTPPSPTMAPVLRYPGFAWHLVNIDGHLFLSVDPTSKYASAQPLTSTGYSAEGLRFRHCLYRYGHNWYEVQLLNVLQTTIGDHRFLPPNSSESVDVFTYTRDRCDRRLPWIRDLSSDTPAVIYRYPGNYVQRFGALQLCWLLHRTDDPDISSLHQQSIMTPRARLESAAETVTTFFQGGSVNGQAIAVSPEPKVVDSRVFAIPALRFGNGRVLSAPQTRNLATYPKQRESMLNDRRAGPLARGPFGPQYLILPLSVSRQVNEHFERELTTAIGRISQDDTYKMRRITYDDRKARTLHQHVEAIRSALDEGRVGSGYGLLLLPQHAPSDLHHWVKTRLQPELQLKCASAASLLRHYQRDGSVRPDKVGRLRGYVDNCAIGALLVNRRWPWAIADPLHHDVHIGIDVLGGVAGLTYLYDGGRRIFFESRRGAKAEQLSSGQLATTIADSMSNHLVGTQCMPTRLLIHRDGRLFPAERAGVKAAVRRLQNDGKLPLDVQVGFVEVHKHTSNNLRLVKGVVPREAAAADVGSWWPLNDTTGIVCTTGTPFRIPGTPQPLEITTSGTTTLEAALEDVFRLSQLGFSAPSLSTRLPIVLKLADDLLEAVAAQYDEDAADYDFISEAAEGA